MEQSVQLGVGLYMYLGLVLLFSVGILIVFFTQRWRYKAYTTEHFGDGGGGGGPEDGDIVVNVSLIARSVSKEMSKLAKEITKNISSFK
jgi:hypothetical protein